MTLESDNHHAALLPEGGARKRALAYGRKETVAAMRLVAGTQVKLSRWHSQVAFLRAWGTGKPADVYAAREQAANLLPFVIAERIELERLIEESEMDIAQHTIVRDVTRALVGVQTNIEEIAHSSSPAGSGQDEPPVLPPKTKPGSRKAASAARQRR